MRMVRKVKLTPKGEIAIMVEAELISPDSFAEKSEAEIGALAVWQGPREFLLSEFFEVEAWDEEGPEKEGGTVQILIDGDVSRVKRIGQKMTGGRIEIRGSSGMHLGSEMAGGEILLRGDAGSWAGMNMSGGLLEVEGSVGDHAGSAYRGSWRGMSGGKILVRGNARSQLGGGISGGEILVEGSVENFCGIRQSGGLILVKGDAVRGVGAEMVGGMIAVFGRIHQFTPGFIEVGPERDPAMGEKKLEGEFVKFFGDYAVSKNPKGVLYVTEYQAEAMR
ncbi:MAG TPA: formylmethanofuran dehydrogenase subunit C [Methanotrichaceae archaeon]|nr:formylmethanofuran dehydrogenase subunit C [Methanotrichaceae archaeon]